MLEERTERAKALLVEQLTDGMDSVELGQIKAKGIVPWPRWEPCWSRSEEGGRIVG